MRRNPRELLQLNRVSSRREGRKSVPVVRVLSRTDGGFNAAGEGVEWKRFEDADFSSISQWIQK